MPKGYIAAKPRIKAISLLRILNFFFGGAAYSGASIFSAVAGGSAMGAGGGSAMGAGGGSAMGAVGGSSGGG